VRRPNPFMTVALVLVLRAVVPGPGGPDPAAGQEGPRPRVVILATGGTIASAWDDEVRAFVQARTGDQLVSAVPELSALARVEVVDVASVGSTNMTPALWLAVSSRATQVLAQEDVAGVVVTHGTDTLEETAYFLDITVASDKPVVLVGSQRAASERDSDGPRNLLNAVRVALSRDAVGMGATIVMNGSIHAAREVTKTHSLALETFDTPEFGALGVVDAGGVRFYRAPLRRLHIDVAPDAELPTVDIVQTYAGVDGRLIRGLMAQGRLDGLVVEAAGAGNLAAALFESIVEARDAGIPVVITSRVHAGPVLPLYGSEGGGLSLQEAGCIFADNLTAQKARVLLIAALSQGWSGEALAGAFGPG